MVEGIIKWITKDQNLINYKNWIYVNFFTLKETHTSMVEIPKDFLLTISWDEYVCMYVCLYVCDITDILNKDIWSWYQV
jgi:hypothetical protein